MTEETVTAATRQRRKRKWDQPAEAVVSSGLLPGLLPFAGMGALQGFPALMGAFPNLPTPIAFPIVAQHSSSSAVQQSAAAAVVQKFNQDLVNKGLLPQAKIQDELIAREITINDAEPGVRYKLTKRQTQEEIQVKTGAVVITRGRYRPPNGPVEPEKPLYLHISAGVHLKDTAERIRAVDQAAAMVEEMLKQGRQTPASSAAGAAGTVASGTAFVPFAISIHVGFEADPSYNLLGRIRGPNDQYINHIMNETGATVTLRGRGSGNREAPSGEELQQPLHLYITSDNAKSLEDAKVLAENLLQTIRPPAYQALPANPPVLAHNPGTYATPQPAPYQPSGYTATGLPHVPYQGYHLPANGTYPPPYAGSQPLYYPHVSAVGVTPSVVQSSPAPVTATDLHANRAPPSKPYAAVPPPVQLLEQSGVTTSGASESSPAEDANRKAGTESLSVDFASSAHSADTSFAVATPAQNTSYAGFCSDSTASTAPIQSSKEAFRPPSYPAVIAAPAYQPVVTTQSVSLACTRAIPSSHGLSQASSYSGYSGVYRQASPLQQVAQVLQRPPPPVSMKPGSTSAYPAPAPTKAQASFTQEKYSDKQHIQRRKFQEFPFSAGKEASGDEQHGRRGASSSIVSDFKTGQEPGVSCSTSLPPPSAKFMAPPPPQKVPLSKSASPTTHAPDSSNNSLSSTTASLKQIEDGHVSHHRTGLKLVEYGEEEEESSEHAESPPSSNGKTSRSFSNGKPFWAA